MPKRVCNNYVGSNKDGWFRSCMYAMLILSAICVKTSGAKKQEDPIELDAEKVKFIDKSEIKQLAGISTTEEEKQVRTTVPPIDGTTGQPAELTTVPEDEQGPIELTEDIDVPKSTSNPYYHRNQCDSCMKMKHMASILSLVTRTNHLGDACEDFYDYACGGDYSDKTLEDNWRKIAARLERINGKSPKAQKTFKNFYDKCIDFQMNYDYADRIMEASNLISRVNQSVEAQDNDKTALTDLLTRLLQIDRSPLFDISVDVDKTSQRFVLQMNIGKRFSAIMNNYVTKRNCLYQSKKHFEFAVSSFNHLDLNDLYKVYFNCYKNYTYNTNVIEDALSSFFQVDDFEEWPLVNVERIGEYFKTISPAQLRKDIVTKNFQYMKVAELNFNYRMIDWKLLLQRLVGQEIDEETLVQVYFPDFFKKMFKLLTDLQSGRKIQDVILGMFAYDLYTNFVLPMPIENPEEFCLKQSADLMPEIASSFYLESFTPEDVEADQKRIENIFDTMKEKLENLIETSDWADPPTQYAMEMKVNNMRLKRWNGSLVWQNDTLLDERMEGVNENYEKYSDFNEVLNKRKQQMTFNIWNTSCYTDKNIWWYFSKPYDTQPAVIYASNLVVIPAGMLFTESNHLPFLSLVKLGFSLGKAIGHHFDYIGSKFNISLQKDALAAYEESESCTEYYYTQEETKMQYDGKSIQFKVADESIGLSIMERFVVRISLNLITSLFNEEKKNYELKDSDLIDILKPEKLFFLALGQEHCTKPNVDDFLLALFESEHLPPALLLNKELINSDEFSKTFKCREGSGINKLHKCRAFPDLSVNYTMKFFLSSHFKSLFTSDPTSLFTRQN